MNIGIKDIITLSDSNRYCVVSKAISNGSTYYYLVDVNIHENLKFCVEDNSELVEIEDENLIKALLPLFANEISDEDIKSILEEQ